MAEAVRRAWIGTWLNVCSIGKKNCPSLYCMCLVEGTEPGSYKSSSGRGLWNQLAYYSGHKNVQGVSQCFPTLEETKSANSTFTEGSELQPLSNSSTTGNRE